MLHKDRNHYYLTLAKYLTNPFLAESPFGNDVKAQAHFRAVEITPLRTACPGVATA